MNGYSWISVVSILCYLFLLLTFITSHKKEKVIRVELGMNPGATDLVLRELF